MAVVDSAEVMGVIARVARATRGLAAGGPPTALLAELLGAARDIAGARAAWLLLAPEAARVLIEPGEAVRLLGSGLALAADDGGSPVPDARLDRVLDAPRVRLLLRAVATDPAADEARALGLSALANLAASQVRRVVEARALRARLGEVQGVRQALARASERPARTGVVDPVTGLRGGEWYRRRVREELHRGGGRLLVGRLWLEPPGAVTDAARRAVARALRDALRRGDVLARLAGTAFGIALPLPPAGEAEAWGRAVTERLDAVARGALGRTGIVELAPRSRWRLLTAREVDELDGTLDRLAS